MQTNASAGRRIERPKHMRRTVDVVLHVGRGGDVRLEAIAQPQQLRARLLRRQVGWGGWLLDGSGRPGRQPASGLAAAAESEPVGGCRA